MLEKTDNKRLAQNTLFLYFRSIFTMIVGIYTSRVVLDKLGIENYGIYNLIAGFVTMFSMVSATFTSSTQRFLSFELGKKDMQGAQKVFSLSLDVHLLLSFLFLLLSETVGLYFINNTLDIAENRLYAANIVYQCSILTFILNLLSVPYNAEIIAHEKMNIFAYVSIYEVLMKLLILYVLAIWGNDVLIVYSVLLMLISFSIRCFYGIYCKSKFVEATYKHTKDRKLLREFFSISGWNFFGSAATVFTFQGINILLNIVGGGVVINAAKGVAGQVEGAVSKFTDDFMRSVDPQITKAYAVNNVYRLKNLVDKGSRFSFYLLAIIGTPIILESDYILSIWLKEPPLYSRYFVSLCIVMLLSRPFSTIADKVILATGKIKKVRIILSVLQVCDIPLSYVILVVTGKPYLFYLAFIFIAWVSLYVRYYYMCEYCNYNRNKMLKGVIGRCLLVYVFALVIPLLLKIFMVQGFTSFLVVTVIAEIALITSIYTLGIKPEERTQICLQIKKHII